jgi:hypothetical protein
MANNHCPPVLLLIFNRPDLTALVFEKIRQVRPAQLFIAADGPRADHPEEAEICLQTRAVVDAIDWPCEVNTLYREQNLGCKKAVGEAITWFFEHVEEGVILEDDCLPHPTFFRFCAELLEHYREDDRIAMISGNTFYNSYSRKTSYYFYWLIHIWGWATWRRAWRDYDDKLQRWPALRNTSWLDRMFGDVKVSKYWRDIFDQMHRGEIDTWDYAWMYSCWSESRLSILPTINLVSNIGFDQRGTHTRDPLNRQAGLPTHPMTFPLVHPDGLIQDDVLAQSHVIHEYLLNEFTLSKRIQRILRKLVVLK